MRNIIVIDEATNKKIWKDEYFGWESSDKAEMAYTSKGYTKVRRETAYDGNIIIWVRK